VSLDSEVLLFHETQGTWKAAHGTDPQPRKFRKQGPPGSGAETSFARKPTLSSRSPAAMISVVDGDEVGDEDLGERDVV
jgi:hypothetical protein